MVKMVVGVLGVTFRMLLRYWAKDSKVLSANIVDMEQFAQQCGLTIWEAKKFNRTIEEIIDIIAEDFIKEFGNQIEDKERKKAIFEQIQKDIIQTSIDENELISEIFNPENLKILIMNQSKKERETWNDAEIGLYTNCVRYISKASINFISKLPSFTPEVLKTVIQRQKEYYDELYGILIEIHSMTSLIENVNVTYREYESTYRENLIEKYNKVELIGSGLKDRRVTRYDMSSAYVELNCIDENGDADEVELSKVFNNSNVVWIKGEAGSGKTTFLQWVAVCAAKNEYNKINNIENTVPIVISLRSVEWPISLYDAVDKITGVYGNSCPKGWMAELLKENRLIILFDGLDEISQENRMDTYFFIEDIVEQHPQIKVLLTSRNSVNDYLNCTTAYYEIVPMKIHNIKKFISYWHKSVLRKDAIIQENEINKLQRNLKRKIVESQPLKQLARNPLLCAMICALNFINNEQLPEDKMELYEKCCEMLMDARDNQRNIGKGGYKNIPRFDYDKKRKFLEELAYWMMHMDVSSENKTRVETYIEHLLRDTNILSDGKNKYSAAAILEFFVERSGIIREPEEGVIDFVHKTFMEFLAVKAICRNFAWNILVKEACNVNWKETIMMCFREMGSKNVEQVLLNLLDKGEESNDDRYFLIASLGASNAVFLANDGIKQKIDIKIRTMIPPAPYREYELAEAGAYLLPFLKDSEKYSNEERIRCLNLLAALNMEEAIPDILSYVLGDGIENAKFKALDLLCEYDVTVLEEYNIREQLLYFLLDSINCNQLTIYERILNIISDMDFSVYDLKIIEKVNSLVIVCGASKKSLYKGKTGFLQYLKNCETIALIGDVQSVSLLSYFSCCNNLVMEIGYIIHDIIKDFIYFKNLTTVKYLKITAQYLRYICENYLINFQNVEVIEICCMDKRFKLEIDSFNNFPVLRKVIIKVNNVMVDDIMKKIPAWKEHKDDLEIVCLQ